MWEVATLPGRLLDYLQQGVVRALLCWIVNSLSRLTSPNGVLYFLKLHKSLGPHPR